jgi:hypothetical protein
MGSIQWLESFLTTPETRAEQSSIWPALQRQPDLQKLRFGKPKSANGFATALLRHATRLPHSASECCRAQPDHGFVAVSRSDKPSATNTLPPLLSAQILLIRVSILTFSRLLNFRRLHLGFDII